MKIGFIGCGNMGKAMLHGMIDSGKCAASDITATVKDIALERKKGKTKAKSQVHLDEVDLEQNSLFDTVKDGDVLEELKNIDVSNLTPIDALNTIYKLQNKLKNRW